MAIDYYPSEVHNDDIDVLGVESSISIIRINYDKVAARQAAIRQEIIQSSKKENIE